MTATYTPTPTPMSHSQPAPRFVGLVSEHGLRAGLCWGDKPRCVNPSPMPHRLHVKTPILTEGFATCGFRTDRGAPRCDTMVVVRRINRLTRAEAQLWFVCEVTEEHVKRLKQGPLLPIEMYTILGCALPGVEYDLPTCTVCGKSIVRHAAAAHEFTPAENA